LKADINKKNNNVIICVLFCLEVSIRENDASLDKYQSIIWIRIFLLFVSFYYLLRSCLRGYEKCN